MLTLFMSMDKTESVAVIIAGGDEEWWSGARTVGVERRW
jgi:hypothetical protein